MRQYNYEGHMRIIDLYQKNIRIRQIIKNEKTNPGMIYFILKKYNIPHRPPYYHRKHTMNERYFKNIDTEEKAYWVGFISADGNILNRPGERYVLRVALQIGDKSHLLKFKKHIEYSGNLTFISQILKNGKPYSLWNITINSKKMIMDLEKLDIGPNKTKTITPCKLIPKKLIRHYWRGLIDGDGHISKDIRGWKIGLAGNKFMTEGFRQFIIMNNIKSKAKIHIKPKSTTGYYSSAMVYAGTKLIKNIVDLLYNDSNIFLDRKMELVKKIMKTPDWNYKYLHISREQFENQYIKLGNWYDVMRSFNIPIGSSYKLRKQKNVRIGW